MEDDDVLRTIWAQRRLITILFKYSCRPPPHPPTSSLSRQAGKQAVIHQERDQERVSRNGVSHVYDYDFKIRAVIFNTFPERVRASKSDHPPSTTTRIIWATHHTT